MKLIIVFFSALLLVAATHKHPQVIIEKSEVLWKAYKVTGSHTGIIGLQSANVQYDENGHFSSAEIEIDMSSILVSDLDEKGKNKLEKHLKSNDFFSVNNYPIADLITTEVIKIENSNKFHVKANLTIKGTTAPIEFEVINVGTRWTAQLEIDRSIYNIHYRSGTFFQNLGNQLIYDLFELKVTLVIE